MKRLFLSIAAALALLCGCSTTQSRYEAQYLLLFDTLTRIVGYADSEAGFDAGAQFIYDSLEEYHRLYDFYNSYDGINNIKTINDNAGIEPVAVDKKIIDLLLFSKDIFSLSEGRVNIALGPVLGIWHDSRQAALNGGEPALPELSELRQAFGHTDIDALIIDEAAGTVFLADSEMRLDVGAVAKGYAVEHTARAAEQMGFSSWLISAGGNVRAIGCKPSGDAWGIGIQNPFDTGRVAEMPVVEICGMSAVTSGSYERYFLHEGRRFHHIIDPATLFPSQTYASVSVLAPDSGMADALSTALFLMPVAEGEKLIEKMENTHALWVFEDGEIHSSPGFDSFVRRSASG
jgi:thiamine biosynthesis lipoprotein